MKAIFPFFFSLITFEILANEYLNVAKYAIWTKQSSMHQNYSSNFGADGFLDTCAISNSSKNSRWVIKLNDSFVISKLKINTGNTNFGSHMEIYISMDSDGGTFCNFGKDNFSSNNVYEITCFNGPTRGNMVTIKNTFIGGIKLCELEILVCKNNFFGVECVKRCNCEMNVTCSKFDGVCPALCAPGFTGSACQQTCLNTNFGASCKKVCNCAIGSACDPVNGTCNPHICQENFFGATCQTSLPKMASEPSIYSLNASSVILTWPSINQRIFDDDVLIEYLIMYKYIKSNVSSDFEIGPRVMHNALLFNHRAAINNLKYNSFYEFQIIPFISEFSQKGHRLQKDVKGVASPYSLIRTKCLAPTVPNITEYFYTAVDKEGEFKPMITVFWTILTTEQSNCDNILFYEIFYEESIPNLDSIVVHKTGAKKQDGSKNLTIGLKFNMRYKIRVSVYNNYPLESSSLPIFLMIGLQPEVRWFIASIIEGKIEIFIISIVVLSTSLIAVCITVIFVCRLNNSRKMDKAIFVNSKYSPIIHNYQDKLIDDCNNEASWDILSPIGPKSDDMDMIPLTKAFLLEPIAVKDLEKFVFATKDCEFKALRREYKSIPFSDCFASNIIAKFEHNIYKNRFRDILPYDNNRVILENDFFYDTSNEKDIIISDYINASYIDGWNKTREYIATQGCLQSTINDFWQMVWQEKCECIVMITNVKERGQMKCAEYWPNEVHKYETYAHICVLNVDIQTLLHYTLRKFEIRLKDEVRKLTHIQFTTWPDHGVPKNLRSVLELRRIMRKLYSNGPIIVHCSAGTGRSGTFIALDKLIFEGIAKKKISVPKCVAQMRLARMNMVQKSDQYIFLYNCLVEYFKFENTFVSRQNFSNYFTTMQLNIEEQFKFLILDALIGSDEIGLSGLQPENIDKNRFSRIVPDDKFRPYLTSRVESTNDYINAVFLDSYISKNAFVVTQTPLPHTVIDFWRLIFEHEILLIVCLHTFDEHDKSFGQYWPEQGEECECGPFAIESLEARTCLQLQIIIRTVRLCYLSEVLMNSSILSHYDPSPRTITILQLLKPITSKEDLFDKANENILVHDSRNSLVDFNNFNSWNSRSNNNQYNLVDNVNNITGNNSQILHYDINHTLVLKHSKKNFERIISIIKLVQDLAYKDKNKSILVHCSNGARDSGLFTILSSLIQQYSQIQEIDIFQTVREFKSRRPHFISSLDEYIFLHDLICSYLQIIQK